MISVLRPPSVRLATIAALLMLLAPQAAWSQANVIANIRVEGARFVSPDGVLAEVNKVLNVGDAFDPDSPADQTKLEQARRQVQALNFFETVRASVQRGDEGVTITFAVVEKQRIQRITFVGNTIFTDDELLDVIASRPGQIVDARTLGRDAQKLAEFFDTHKRMASVDPSVDDFGVVTFVISEAIVEEVIIEGLRKTKPRVVRNRIKVKPGDVYDEDAIRKDLLAISNTGLFEEPDVRFRQGVKDPERGVILVYLLKEKRTGTATAGLGYNSLDNLVGIISASETNFRGRGERITGTIQFGGRQSYELGFFEPDLDRHGTTFEINVFDTERRRQFLAGGQFSTGDREFDEHRQGFNLTVTRPMAENLKLSLRIRQEQISDPFFQVARTLAPGTGAVGSLQALPGSRGRYIPEPPPNPDLKPDIAEPGDSLLPLVVYAPLADENLSSVTLGALLDTRDLIHNPSRGQFTAVFVEQAGMFGGDSDFTKVLLDARRYLRVQGKHVVAVRLLGGATLGSVPLVESFSAGGAYTIRGFDEDRFRGQNMLILNLEYRVPVTKSITGVAFVDLGDAWGGDFPTKVPGFFIPAEHDSFRANVGVGAGVRVNVGPFGMMRLDVGRSDEDTQVHLSFGHMF